MLVFIDLGPTDFNGINLVRPSYIHHRENISLDSNDNTELKHLHPNYFILI